MKTITFKYALILFLMPSLLFAGEIKGKYKREKTIKKAYAVNSNAMLDVNNKYGSIFVTTWDQNTTEIDVVITVAGNNESQVTKRFNDTDVAFSATKALVTAKTKVGSSGGNVSMEINYTIKIPKKGNIKLNNQYGNIRTGQVFGTADIDCQYGNLTVENLNSSSNKLKLAYCGAAKGTYIKSANINAQYSHLNLGKVDDLQLATEYTVTVINDVEKVTYRAEYGEINFRNAGNITGSSGYTTTRFGRLSGVLNLSCSYGDIKVESVDKSVRNIAITSEYTGIAIGLDESYPFDFEINTQYTGLRGTGGFKFTQKQEKNNHGYYKGYYSASGKNKLYIASQYGNINFM